MKIGVNQAGLEIGQEGRHSTSIGSLTKPDKSVLPSDRSLEQGPKIDSGIDERSLFGEAQSGKIKFLDE